MQSEVISAPPSIVIEPDVGLIGFEVGVTVGFVGEIVKSLPQPA
jgi:hypothetical protein